jgi:pimeloyl-ACP methyl ester carboxylesterase
MGTGAQPPVWQALATVDVPLRYVAGEDDARFVAIGRRLVGSMRRASLSVIEGAGHAAHLEQPEATAADLLAFFRAPTA